MGRQVDIAKAQRALERYKAATTAPVVIWARLDEPPALFAARARRAKGSLILAVVPHDYGASLPTPIRTVEFPSKHFRLLHPDSPKRYRVLKGGRGSAKSHSIA